MKNNEIDVLAINESRMDNSIAPELITIHGYNWVSKDRNRFGGGIGFYIRSTINYCLRPDLNDNELEILTIEIIKNKVKPFLITTWYRPPSDSISTLYKFESCLKLIVNEDKESIILGDINCDLLDNNPTSLVSELKFITNLYQLIKEPTRVTKDTSSLIDHFYTTNTNHIISSGVTAITISDHYLIYGIRKFKTFKQSPRFIEYRDFINTSMDKTLCVI
jgi:exonuclease III